MRRLPLLIGVLIGTAACQEQRSFDERYTNAKNELERRADELDSDLNRARPAEGAPDP